MRTKEEWTRLFQKLEVKNPEEWAACEVNEDLGNLPAMAFLYQAWQEIPRTNDALWLEEWMKHAARQPDEAHIVAGYERLLSLGASKADIVNICRGVMSQFLRRIAYLLNDPSIYDEELAEAASWQLFQIDRETDDPIRPLGCIHELVFSLDPENTNG